MDKQALLQRVLDRLTEQLKTMRHAARTSHDAATGNESKSEGKYDTRGLEASYLADAQAEQCEKVAQAIHILNGFSPDTPESPHEAQAGSVVEVESDGDIRHYYLLPCGGGITIDDAGYEITTLTPNSPLYQTLVGSSQGDLIGQQDQLILDVL